jgi:hypothetical protein
MSIPPRGSHGRRLSIREGGRRVALLVAVASVAGTGALTPAVAGTAAPDPCETQPGGVAVGADGQPAACAPAAAADPPADQPEVTDPTTTGSAPPAPPVPTTSEPASTAEPAAPTGPEPVTPTGPEPAAPADPAPIAQQPAAAEAPAPGDETQRGPDVESSPPAERPTAAAAPHLGVPGGRAQDRATRPSSRPSGRGDRRRDADRADRRSRRRHRATGLAAPGSTPATGQDVSSLALPSDWASLEPIVLPQFSPDDFPVPAHLLPLYQAAAAEYGLPWEVLAAINEVETHYGQDVGVSTAGAVGFMQFLPSTWERWGRDADGDRRRDPYNPADAIFSAARYLHAAGAARDLGGAIFAYNHSSAYVAQVVTRARELAGLDADQVTALTEQALEQHRELYQVDGSPFFGPGLVDPTPGQVLLMTAPQLTRRVLEDERIDLYACGRADAEAGRIDARVLATLLFLAESGFRLQVSSLECGHGVMTASGNVSAHSYGAAVDIAAVDGTPIAGHQGPGSITEDVLRRLVDLQGRMRPNQIISLMTLDQATNTLAMADHADHIHVGFPRAVELPQR